MCGEVCQCRTVDHREKEIDNTKRCDFEVNPNIDRMPFGWYNDETGIVNGFDFSK